jgi:phage shock protein A
MLDQVKDPVKMINEYLRQLNENLYEAQACVAAMMADETKLHTKLLQYQTEAEQWQSKAELALRAGDEELARQALARKLQAQKLAARYKQAYEEQGRYVEKLQDALMKLEMRIMETKSKRAQISADLIVVDVKAIQRTVRGLRSTHALCKIDLLEERIDERLAHAVALARLDRGTLEARFADLELDQELEALRRKVSGQS